MKRKNFIIALLAMLWSFSLSVNAQVAKIGEQSYDTFAKALEAANAMTGDVTVEVLSDVEFVDGMELNGSYTAIKFIGTNNAKMTINQTAGGDYLTAHGKTVTFTDLTLAKANPAWAGNSGHMGNYFSIQGGTATYTNCTFPNGACTSGGTATYNDCTFQNSSEYGLWVYDDALVTVNGGTFDSTKGVKVYSEDETSVTSTLTVQNATFTENVTAKPAVAVGYAQSITLIGNTYNNTTGHVELDSGSDADCEGITFVAQDSEGNDISSTMQVVDRSNSSAACGVLVDGKIYTTVEEAAKDATAGDVVTLLYNTTETVTLPEGVTLDTNGFTAENVTVTLPAVAKIGDVEYSTLAEAIAAIGAGDVVIELLADATFDYNARDAYGTAETTSVTINGNGKTLTLNQKNSDWASIGLASGKLVLNNMTIEKTGYGDTSGAWNTHAIIFSCPVEMTNVTVNNSMAVQAGAKLTNVNINEANEYYGLWINGNGQAVTMTGGSIVATNGGRGIKVADQYIDAPAQVTLNVSGTTFETAKKAAVMVSSTAGAKVSAENVDISKVAADSQNMVWVDEDWAANYGNVEVTGANVSQEAAENFVAAITEGDAVKSYFKTLQEALDAAAAGTGNVTVTILDNVNLTGVTWNPVTVSASGYPLVTVEGNDKTITGLTDMLFAGTWAGGSGLIIKNLTIENSAIVNDKDDAKGTVGVGAFIGFPQASATITLENCHLKNSSVEGGHWTGGLIGYAAGYAGTDGPVFMDLTIKDCSVTGSTITGKGSVGGIIGHGSGNGWTNVVIEETTVSGNTITSTGDSNVKAGAVMGTIGAAGQPTTTNGVTKTGGASVSATVSDNTVKSNGTEITTIYGRQGTNTGMLYVAGGSYDNYPIEEGVAYAAPAEGYKIVENTDGTFGVQEDPAYGKVAKIGDTYYATLADAVEAAESGATITLLNGEHELPLFANKELTFVGESKEGVIVNDAPAAVTQGWNGSTFHFENLTAKGATANYHGLANGVVAVSYKDCNINGLRFLYATESVSFDGCAFNAEGVEHSFWTYGASNITVKNSTFTYTDRAVNCYSENGADHETDITFEGCSFTYAGTADAPDGAVEINSGSVKSIDLVMNDCTAPEKGSMWFNSQWDSKEGENTVVTVDDVIVWQVVKVAKIGDAEYATLAKAVEAATAGQTITMIADVELTETVTVPAGANITLDLNGKQIKSSDITITVLGELTVIDNTEAGKIISTHATGNEAVAVKEGGKFTLNSGNIEGASYGVYLYTSGGTAIINGGTITLGGDYKDGMTVAVASENCSLTVTGGTFEANGVNYPMYTWSENTIELKGGMFDFNPNLEYVAKEYAVEAVTDKEGWFKVVFVEPMIAIQGGDSFYNLSEAFAAAKENDVIVISKAGEYIWPSTAIPAGVTVKATVEGVVATSDGTTTINATTLTVENVDFKAVNKAAFVGNGKAKNLTFTDCSFTGLYAFHVDAAAAGAELNFNNCEFNGFTTFATTVEKINVEGGNVNGAFIVRQDATINGVEFSEDAVIQLGTTDAVTGKDIVIEDCTVADTNGDGTVLEVLDIFNGADDIDDTNSVVVNGEVISGAVENVRPENITITINEYGSGTYCSEWALDFANVEGDDDAFKAYAATGYNPTSGIVTMTRQNTARPKTGLFIKGTPGATYTIPVLESTDDYTMNMLVGTLEQTTLTATSSDGKYANLVYKVNDGVLMFVRAVDNQSSSRANGAYLQIPIELVGSASSAKGAKMIFDDEETTGINEIEINGLDGTVYDLQGRRVINPAKGMYIINGKKVFIK